MILILHNEKTPQNILTFAPRKKIKSLRYPSDENKEGIIVEYFSLCVLVSTLLCSHYSSHPSLPLLLLLIRVSFVALAQLCAAERDCAGNRSRVVTLPSLCNVRRAGPSPFVSLSDLSIVDHSVCSLFHLAAGNEMQSGTCWTCLSLQCMQAG